MITLLTSDQLEDFEERVAIMEWHGEIPHDEVDAIALIDIMNQEVRQRKIIHERCLSLQRSWKYLDNPLND